MLPFIWRWEFKIFDVGKVNHFIHVMFHAICFASVQLTLPIKLILPPVLVFLGLITQNDFMASLLYCNSVDGSLMRLLSLTLKCWVELSVPVKCHWVGNISYKPVHWWIFMFTSRLIKTFPEAANYPFIYSYKVQISHSFIRDSQYRWWEKKRNLVTSGTTTKIPENEK